MALKIRLGIVIVISLVCLAAVILPGFAPAAADNATTVLPYPKTWGNSSGRTGCNATSWGRSDTSMGCSGANNNSKCFFVPCKYCR